MIQKGGGCPCAIPLLATPLAPAVVVGTGISGVMVGFKTNKGKSILRSCKKIYSKYTTNNKYSSKKKRKKKYR